MGRRGVSVVLLTVPGDGSVTEPLQFNGSVPSVELYAPTKTSWGPFAGAFW
ncbi:MAG: hypothetical protein WDO13_21920 [Verrucomicrobiota bacterium]